MVECEYCNKELPKGQKRVTYYFLVMEPGEKIHPKGVKAHVDEHHHVIKVCKTCEKKCFPKDN